MPKNRYTRRRLDFLEKVRDENVLCESAGAVCFDFEQVDRVINDYHVTSFKKWPSVIAKF